MKTMRKIPKTLLLIGSISLAGGAVGELGLHGCASAPKPPQEDAASTPVNNFGFPLGFSTRKMDPSADPRKDFRRYARRPLA